MYRKAYFANPLGQSFHYLIYLPPEYDPKTEYPLLVFLHGAGERGPADGSRLDDTARHGFFCYAREGKEYPFLMVAPQCPGNNYWACYTESLNRFLDEILRLYRIDKTRIYLTGLSMGGTGTWMWGIADPERFAAIAPVCGTGVYWFGEKLAGKPVWAFHGDRDDICLPEESINMVRSVNRFGNSARLTMYPGVGHDAWEYAYQGDELVNWFLQQHL